MKIEGLFPTHTHLEETHMSYALHGGAWWYVLSFAYDDGFGWQWALVDEETDLSKIVRLDEEIK